MSLLVVLTVLAGVRPATAQQPSAPANQWTPIGPQFSTVLALQHDPFDAAVVLAGLYFGGLYRSADYGFSWAHVPTPFSTRSVFALDYDPNRPGVVYAGTFRQGVFKSTDGGLTWLPVNSGMTDPDVQAIAVDPFDSNTVIASTASGGVFRSTTAGASWTRTDDAAHPLIGKTIAFDPMRAGVVYIGTIGTGAFRSADDGLTWLPFNAGLADTSISVLSLRFSRPTAALYAATDNGVYKLRDGDPTWTNITLDLPLFPTNDLMPHPTVPNMVFAATLTGTFVRENDEIPSAWIPWTPVPARGLGTDRSGTVMHVASVHGGLEASVDFGTNWYQANWGMQNLFIGALAVVGSPTGPVIYAGSDVRVHKGDSVGWTTAFEPKQAIFDIQPHPTNPDTVFIGTERGGVYKTADAGRTWTTASTDIAPSQVFALAESSDQTATYAATTSGLYVRGTASGAWTLANTGENSIFLSIAADPVRRPILYLGGHEGVVLKSIDGGFSFTFAGNGLPKQNVIKLVSAPWEKVYAITADGGIYASSDFGVNWFPVSHDVTSGATAVAVNPVQPWIVYLGTSGGGVFKSESGALDWTPANTGLDSPFIFALAVDPTTPSTVYAATHNGLFKSTNAAATWSRVGTGLPGGTITSLAVDATNSRLLYASIDGAGIYRSTDSGVTWTPASGGLPTDGTVPFLVSRVNGAAITAGTHLKGVWTSTNAGDSWSRSSLGMTLFVRGLAIDPVTPSTMYAGSLGGGVFKSTNSADSWTNVGLRDRNILRLAVDPKTPSTVFAATSRGVSRTRDAAASWQHLGQKAAYVYSLAVDPRDRRRLFVGTTAGAVYRSVDGGDTWDKAASLPLLTVHALAVDAAGVLYASPDRQGVFRSTDSGDTWTELTSGASPRGQLVSAIDVDSTGTLFAATAGGGVFRYRNGAWSFASEGLASGQLAHLAIASDNVLYAATFDAGLFRSLDGGASWIWASNGLTTSRVTAVAPDPANPARVYAATPDGVYVSPDRGLTWVARNAGLDRISVHRVVVDLFAPNTLYAATNGHGVFRSQDGGLTWSAASAGLINRLVPSMVQGAAAGALFAGTVGGGISRTSNGGVQWQGGTIPQIVDNFMLGIAVNPQNPAIVYAAGSGQGVLKSTNGGIDWWPANNGLEVPTILSLILDKEHPDTLYTGTVEGGVFYTTNGGGAWKPLNNGLWNDVVTSLSLNPADSSQLFAGTEGGGVFFNHVDLAPTTCTYAVDAATLVVPPGASTSTLHLTTAEGCTWSVAASDDWVTLPGGFTGTGSATITLSIALHTGEDARSTTILVAGTPISLVQQGQSKLFRLTVQKVGSGAGSVSSDWVGISCGGDCEQLFTDHLPVVLSTASVQGSRFVGWEGNTDCSDGRVVMSTDMVCIARFELTGDYDDDGLPDMWELQFGLDPGSANGDNGASGDPDHDGVTNAEERAGGTHPRGFVVRYFADGQTGTDTRTKVDLFNGGTVAARVLLTTVPAGSIKVPMYLHPHGRQTLDLGMIVSGSFSIVIESDIEVAVERTIQWGHPSGSNPNGSSAERASAASDRWYLPTVTTTAAASSTVVLFNPGAAAVSATVTYLAAGTPPVMRTHAVPASSRLAVAVADDGAPEHATAIVDANGPIVVEQITALDGRRGAIAESGAPAASFAWYFAEGTTATAMSSTLSIFNPTSSVADVRVAYLLPSGFVERTHTIDPFATVRVDVASEDSLLASTPFSAIAWSANGVPFVASRETWWPGGSDTDWYEGHGSRGAESPGAVWALAGGSVGGNDNAETTVAIANVGPSATNVRVTVFFDDKSSEVRVFSVGAANRLALSMVNAFPSTAWRAFSVLVESLGAGGGGSGGNGAQPIVVERATYASPGGVPWARGASVVGLRLAP